MIQINIIYLLLFTMPILINAMLVVCAIIVATTLKYAAILVVYLAIITFPLVVLWHVGLIVAGFFVPAVAIRLIALVYGLANSTVSLLLCGYCIAITAQYFIRPGID